MFYLQQQHWDWKKRRQIRKKQICLQDAGYKMFAHAMKPPIVDLYNVTLCKEIK